MAETDLGTLEALEQLRELVADDADPVVVDMESSVRLETQQFGVYGREVVVRKDDGGHLVVVVFLYVQLVEGLIVDVVVAEVEDDSVCGQGGEGGEVGGRAVDDDGVGWAGVFGESEVIELAVTELVTGREDEGGVDGDDREERSGLTRVLDVTGQVRRLQLTLH